MPTYVSLVKWTEQGIQNVKETVQRTQDMQAVVERCGGKVLSCYWVQGDLLWKVKSGGVDGAIDEPG